MLRYFIFIEYGLLPDLRVGVLISASQIGNLIRLPALEIISTHLQTISILNI